MTEIRKFESLQQVLDYLKDLDGIVKTFTVTEIKECKFKYVLFFSTH